MDYDQIGSFLEVAKLQSFSRAAEKLFRTQPAISAQVRLLEQECGEKLFDRWRCTKRLSRRLRN